MPKAALAWRHAAVGCVVLALAAAEAGVALFVFLGAYVLAFEPGSPWKRVAALAPELAVFAAWGAFYVLGGYGAHGMGFYRSATETMLEGPLDLPIWLFSLLGPSVVSAFMIAPVALVRCGTLLAVLPLVAALWCVAPRTRESFFFMLSALGCVAITLTTIPQERITTCASFGAFGLIAMFIESAKVRARRWLRGVRVAFITFHIVLAPVLFLALLHGGGPVDRAARSLAAAVPTPAPDEVIVLNTPLETLTIFAHELLNERGAEHALHHLYAGGANVELERIDERALELRAKGGWARMPIEGMFASLSAMPPLGATQAIGPMQITVRETEPDGRPRRVEFRFPDALDAPHRLWLEWHGTGPRVWTPPPIGTKQSLEPLSMLRSLPK